MSLNSAKREKAFLDDLRQLVQKHRIGIVGTCENEGIYGEITLFDLDNPDECSWNEPEGNMNSQLEAVEPSEITL